MSVSKTILSIVLLFVFYSSASAVTLQYTISGTLLQTTVGPDAMNVDGANFSLRYTIDSNALPRSIDSSGTQYQYNADTVNLTFTGRPNGFSDFTSSVSGTNIGFRLINADAPVSDSMTFYGGRIDAFGSMGYQTSYFTWTDGPNFWVSGQAPTPPADFLNTINFTAISEFQAGNTRYTPQGLSLQVNAVPIPPALWLFGSGLLGLIGIARRKKT